MASKRDAFVVLFLDDEGHWDLNGHGVGLGYMDWVGLRNMNLDWNLDWIGNWLLNWIGYWFLNSHGVGFGHMNWIGPVDGYGHLHGIWHGNMFLDGHRIRMRHGHLHLFGDHNGLMMVEAAAPVRAKTLVAPAVKTFMADGAMSERAVAQAQAQAAFVFVACRWGLVFGRVHQGHDDTNNDL